MAADALVVAVVVAKQAAHILALECWGAMEALVDGLRPLMGVAVAVGALVVIRAMVVLGVARMALMEPTAPAALVVVGRLVLGIPMEATEEVLGCWVKAATGRVAYLHPHTGHPQQPAQVAAASVHPTAGVDTVRGVPLVHLLAVLAAVAL